MKSVRELAVEARGAIFKVKGSPIYEKLGYHARTDLELAYENLVKIIELEKLKL